MAEPIRIVQVVGPVLLGGVDTVVMNYYRNIDRSQIQFDFIMDGYEDTPIDHEIQALGGTVFKVEPYAKNMWKSMHQYYEIFHKSQYRIVHSHMNSLSVFPLFEAWRAGIPIRIAHSHSTAAKGEGKKNVMKYTLRPFAKRFPTHYCACSELAGKWLFGEKFYNKGKVNLIKNAIDLQRFSYNEGTRNRIRSELGVGNRFAIGHVGRFVYQKNHDFLINIFYEVHKKNSDSVLILAGDGPLMPTISQKVKELRLSESVRFLGLRRDVSELLQAMDVFVLPSRYEGLGMVAVESQIAGLPTICSAAVPPEAIISDRMTYLSLNESPSVWAETVLSQGNAVRGIPILTDTAKDYNIKEAAERLCDYYLSLHNTINKR